jgi:hypothetical protein
MGFRYTFIGRPATALDLMNVIRDNLVQAGWTLLREFTDGSGNHVKYLKTAPYIIPMLVRQFSSFATLLELTMLTSKCGTVGIRRLILRSDLTVRTLPTALTFDWHTRIKLGFIIGSTLTNFGLLCFKQTQLEDHHMVTVHTRLLLVLPYLQVAFQLLLHTKRFSLLRHTTLQGL